MSKNLNHIAFCVYSLTIGGVERTFLNYAQAFVDRGYQVDIVVCRAQGVLMDSLPVGVQLVDLGNIKLRNMMLPLRRYLKHSTAATLIVGPELTNFMAILVNASLPPKYKVKVIVTQHSVSDDDDKDLGFIGRLFPLGKRIFYRFAHAVVAVSKGVAADLERIGVPRCKIQVIYNPIDIRKIEQQAAEVPNVALPEYYAIFVGRLATVKNVGLLIEAFAHLKRSGLNLVIVGEGPMGEQWRHLAKQLGVSERIHFVGAISNPAPVMQKAQTVVFPSFSEAMPMGVLEALALGKTVVHTPNLGCKEILDTQHAYCSQRFDDPDDFARTLVKGLDHPINPDLLKRYVKRFDQNQAIRQMEDLFCHE